MEQDFEKAIRWYHSAAEAGHAGAMHCLGWAYAHGEGVEKDMQQAVYWYEQGARHGDSAAMNNLGECYAQGQGVNVTLTKQWSFIAKQLKRRCHRQNIIWADI